MSNLYKTGFISFAEQTPLVIDANNNKVIRQIEETKRLNLEEQQAAQEGELQNDSDSEFQSFEIENIDLGEVREQAGAIFEDAQAAAEKIIEDARAEALMLKEEAKQSAVEEGYQEGLAKAQEQLQAQEQELQNRYELIRQQLEEDYEQQLRSMEPQMVDVICRVLHKMTGIMIREEQGVMVHIIDNALKNIENTNSISIKVSEDDYADVYSQFGRIKQQVNSNVEIELISDAKLAKLECFIETETGIINCSLNEQLKHLVHSLKLLSEI